MFTLSQWFRSSDRGGARAKDVRPLLLLTVAVLAPTVCLLWFMSAAMQNESLAVRQKLTEAYRSHLGVLQSRLELHWQKTIEELESLGKGSSAQAWFARVVQSGKVDGLVVLGRQGEALYPDAPSASASDFPEPNAEWLEANRREWLLRDWLGAAKRYESIAASTTNVNLAARAIQAQARCLMQAGRNAATIRLITESLEREKYSSATDAQGRLIVANAELLVLQLLNDPKTPVFQVTANKLMKRLRDYEHSVLASPQRRFLMKELQTLWPTGTSFPTLHAEELVSHFLDSHPNLPEKSQLAPASLPGGLWQIKTTNGRALALFRTDTLVRRIAYLLKVDEELSEDVSIALVPPGAEVEPPFVSMAAGPTMPGWQLAVTLIGPSPFEAATKQRLATYLWTGILMVLAVYILALIAARSLRRQVALSRLKNDLVATVSHELKTPLASIRVLVDTLLESDQFEQQTAREYLQLIAKENDRLTRIIENFLTFSRMERNKYVFQFKKLSATQIVDSVARTVRPRFAGPGCEFEVEVPHPLPEIEADADTLTTALLNLLDNAYKYSEASKHIVLRAGVRDGCVAFEVEDNGIGIPARETSKIFEDFYQVDQQLSRKRGGCGLGLSIVQLIMKAHMGSVRVSSQPGRGSKFTLLLPALATSSPNAQEVPA